MDTTFTKNEWSEWMNELNEWMKSLESISFKISTDRPLVNRITKESNLSINANLD